jgi:hypothetical protein
MSVDHEIGAMASGNEKHSAINRVMLAMTLLCPGSLKRTKDDPLISL